MSAPPGFQTKPPEVQLLIVVYAGFVQLKNCLRPFSDVKSPETLPNNSVFAERSPFSRKKDNALEELPLTEDVICVCFPKAENAAPLIGVVCLLNSVTAARLLKPWRLTLAGRIEALAKGVAIANIGTTALSAPDRIFCLSFTLLLSIRVSFRLGVLGEKNDSASSDDQVRSTRENRYY